MRKNKSQLLFPWCSSCLLAQRHLLPTCPIATSSVVTSMPTAARWLSSSTNTTCALFPCSITKSASSVSSTPNRSSLFYAQETEEDQQSVLKISGPPLP